MIHTQKGRDRGNSEYKHDGTKNRTRGTTRYKMDDTSTEINPYKELIVNNAEKIEPLMTQMEQWSIFSNVKLCTA